MPRTLSVVGSRLGSCPPPLPAPAPSVRGPCCPRPGRPRPGSRRRPARPAACGPCPTRRSAPPSTSCTKCAAPPRPSRSPSWSRPGPGALAPRRPGPGGLGHQAAPGMSTGHAATLQAVATACEDPRLADLAAAVESGAVSLRKAAQLARFHAATRGVADLPARSRHGHPHRQRAAPDRERARHRDPAHGCPAASRARHRAPRGPPSSRPDPAQDRRPGRDEHLPARPRPRGAAILDAAIDPLARPQRHPDGGASTARASPRARASPTAPTAPASPARSGRAGGSSPTCAQPLPAAPTHSWPLSAEGLIARRGAEDCQGRRGRHPRLRHPGRPAHGLGQRMPRLRRGTDEAHRGRAHPRTGAAQPRHRASPRLRGRHHPRGAGYRLRGPRRRPHQAARATRDPPCGLAPGRRVHLPRVRSPRSGATRTTPSWWRGGETSLANTALLCGRHHTLAHDRAACTIADTGVTWHL